MAGWCTPPSATCTATAVGAASGFGRLGASTGPLIGGWLLTAGLAHPWGFYILAVVAALGALSIALVNRDPAPSEHGSMSSREGNTRCALK